MSSNQEDKDFKAQYKKYKYKLKMWEVSFKKKHNRIPSKYDILEATPDIRHIYKTYYRLKTSMLEKTLASALNDDDDGFDVSALNITNNELAENVSVTSNCSSDISMLIHAPSISTELCGLSIKSDLTENSSGLRIGWTEDDVKVHNENAWIKEVSNDSAARDNTKRKNMGNALSKTSSEANLNLSNKLFRHASFSKRNPKKPLLRKRSSVNASEGGSNTASEDTLPDLETILIKKSKNLDPIDAILNSKTTNKDMIINKMDQGWLKRCDPDNNESENTKSDSLSTKLTKLPNKVQLGISNVNHVTLSKILADDINPLTGLEIETNFNDNDDVIDDSDDESANSSRLCHISKRRKISNGMGEKSLSLNSKETIVSQEPVDHKFATINNIRKSQRLSKHPNIRSSSQPMEAESNDDYSKAIVSPKTKKSVFSKTIDKITKLSKNMINSKTIETSDSNVVEELPQIDSFVTVTNTEQIISAPRINDSELKKSSNRFMEFLRSSNNHQKVDAKSQYLNSVEEQKRQRLEKKITSGTLNENFVRINIEKKKFVRGKRQFNISKYKKQMWKKQVAALSGPNMNMGGCDGNILTCFTCGKPGHFAQNCTAQGDGLLPLGAVDEIDDSIFPTLEEAEQMAKEQQPFAHRNKTDNVQSATDIKNSDYFSNNEMTTMFSQPIPQTVLEQLKVVESAKVECTSLYQIDEHNKIIDTPDEVFEALKLFGHTNFRSSQEKAIMRVLSGISTLVTLSTGSGKSLIYQLPAYLYARKLKCITLVISPLVSLMEDQVHGVPGCLRAYCLHTNQTQAQRDKIFSIIKSNELDVLLLSPEAIVAGEKSSTFGQLFKQLPPIAFACIDEVHCLSEWSHNFRPSYLMICRVLKETLNVKTILGLTATATEQTKLSIAQHIGISDGIDGVISDIPIPSNLVLSVSKDSKRDEALINLLRSERFSDFNSIIVYCIRREECERVAALLRTVFQDNKTSQSQNKNKRKRSNNLADVYHAGLVASKRKSVQNAFMRGDLRIVVATVAFGMGINKADIRAIIHYNMPKNFESYVQEIGRAGRDGKEAHCHLFLNHSGSDIWELKRHIYANSIERFAIRKLLDRVFVKCGCKLGKEDQKCLGHEICFAVEETVEQLDLPEENIETLLCYLELNRLPSIKVLGKAYTKCKVLSYNGPSALKKAAANCPPLAMAIALDLQKGIDHSSSSVIEFPVVEVASTIGWDSGIVKYILKKLEWTTDNGKSKRSSISVSFSELGFRIRAPGNVSDNDLNNTLDTLHKKVLDQELRQMIQLKKLFDGANDVSFNTFDECCEMDSTIVARSDQMKDIIRNYFRLNLALTESTSLENDAFNNQEDDEVIINDIRVLYSMYPDSQLNGRAIARIFHGVQSPNYPAVVWGRCRYWRAHLQTDFNRIIKLANQEIIKMRTS